MALLLTRTRHGLMRMVVCGQETSFHKLARIMRYSCVTEVILSGSMALVENAFYMAMSNIGERVVVGNLGGEHVSHPKTCA